MSQYSGQFEDNTIKFRSQNKKLKDNLQVSPNEWIFTYDDLLFGYDYDTNSEKLMVLDSALLIRSLVVQMA